VSLFLMNRLLLLLINGLVNTFPMHRKIVGGDISFAVRVLTKKSK
jgi:hypothetical protein